MSIHYKVNDTGLKQWPGTLQRWKSTIYSKRKQCNRKEHIMWAQLSPHQRKTASRFCADYRKLEAETIRDWYSLRIIDEYIYSLGNAPMFSNPVANSGFLQVKNNILDRWKLPSEVSTACKIFLWILFRLIKHWPTSKGRWKSPYCQ